MDMATAETTLAAAILRTVPEADHVVFADDGEHIFVGPVEGRVVRYRLGAVAQRFLHGEFDTELPAEAVVLHPPEKEQDE